VIVGSREKDCNKRVVWDWRENGRYFRVVSRGRQVPMGERGAAASAGDGGRVRRSQAESGGRLWRRCAPMVGATVVQ
jgi:hypothetical protein